MFLHSLYQVGNKGGRESVLELDAGRPALSVLQ